MKVTPDLKVCRFEQLSPGDLFFFEHDNGCCAALKVIDPTQNDEPLVLPFGPNFPRDLDGPYLLPRQQTNVVSFGKEYVLELPVDPSGWSLSEPARNILCIATSEEGYFVRANSAHQVGEFRPCFISLETGVILTIERGLTSEFIRPRGSRAMATGWRLLTTEAEPRLIFPHSSAAMVGKHSEGGRQ